jgi:hypothetical protein
VVASLSGSSGVVLEFSASTLNAKVEKEAHEETAQNKALGTRLESVFKAVL